MELKNDEKLGFDIINKASLLRDDNFNQIEIEKTKKDLEEENNKLIVSKIEHSNNPMWNETCVQFMYANNKFWRREL